MSVAALAEDGGQSEVIGAKGEKELENITIGHLGRPGSFTVFTNECKTRGGFRHLRAMSMAVEDRKEPDQHPSPQPSGCEYPKRRQAQE
jgi:hypothetical protein